MEKKEISLKTATRAIITGFISYGILIGFICFIVLYNLNAYFNIFTSKNIKLTILIPLLCSILLLLILRFICRLSTFDVFKKCYTKQENVPKIYKKMNIFFSVLLFSIFIFMLINLFITLYNMQMSIYTTASIQSQVFSENFNELLTIKMFEESSIERFHLIVRTILYEIGIIVSFVALVPFQKRMILKYNK